MEKMEELLASGAVSEGVYLVIADALKLKFELCDPEKKAQDAEHEAHRLEVLRHMEEARRHTALVLSRNSGLLDRVEVERRRLNVRRRAEGLPPFEFQLDSEPPAGRRVLPRFIVDDNPVSEPEESEDGSEAGNFS